MFHCPSSEVLEQLLAGSLSDEDSQLLSKHVEACGRCQTELDTQSPAKAVVIDVNVGSRQVANQDEKWTTHRVERFVKVLLDAQQTSARDQFLSEATDLPKIAGYDVERILGRGGMGVVLKARHQRMQRDVAIKVLPQTALKDETAIRRFYREAQAVAALSHPNIVAAFDAGEQGDLHYLVMEFVDGWDLGAVISHGSLSVADAVECIIQAASGLQQAHQRNMIHRDIKPSNLMLDRFGNVKVLDLGLARFSKDAANQVNGELTQTGQFMGSIDYMAPEQVLDSRTADHRSDIYSLGCTLYYLLTGECLYTADTLMKRILSHRDEPIPYITAKRSDVPKSIEDVFRKMVAKTPDARHQSMTDLIDELTCARVDEQLIEQPDLSALVERLELFDQQHDETVNLCSQPTIAAERSACNQIESSIDDPTLVNETNRNVTHSTGIWRKTFTAFAMFVAIGALAMVLFSRSSEGTLRVEINDPTFKVQLKDTEFIFTQENQDPIAIKPGGKTLVVTRDDFTFETNQFILKKGETIVVKVDLLPGEIQVVSAGNVIGQRKLEMSSRGDESHVPSIPDDSMPPEVASVEPLTPDQQKFLNNLRLLPAELQRQEVVAKLQRINGIVGPIYNDPKGLRLPEFTLKNGAPVAVKITDWRMSLLWPLEAFPTLTSIDLSEASVSDLTPLRRLPNLNELKIELAVYNPDADGLLKGITQLTTINQQPAEKYFETRAQVRREIDEMAANVDKFSSEAVIGWLESQLKKLNPEWTGRARLGNPHNRENDIGYWQEGGVTTLEFYGISNVTDISPVRALPMDSFRLGARTGGDTVTTHRYDLAPLKGLPLETIAFSGRLRDLESLRGMPLKNLSLFGPVTDLSPLSGMPLETVSFDYYDNPLTDISPLQNAPLVKLDIRNSLVPDLRVLTGKKLISLELYGTPVTDISLLKDMPLEILTVSGWNTPRIIADISVAKGMPLKRFGVHIRPYFEPEVELLKSLPLEVHPEESNRPIDEFWQEFHAARENEATYIASLAKLTPEQRAHAVEEKLGSPANFTYVVTDGAVTELSYSPYHNASLSLWPLRAFPNLSKVKLQNSGKLQYMDLSPLIGLPIEELSCGNAVDYNLPVLREMKSLKTVNGKQFPFQPK